ncbi:hypothetical protein HT031_006150 [Scenedesmus sp. PABB004]|nr:hypothetical protein HT031_006150 [Scenedesmus sp. PABB004]
MKTALLVLALLGCAGLQAAAQGGSRGNAGPGAASYERDAKISDALSAVHGAIDKAAVGAGRKSTTRATTVSAMMTNAAIDQSVTHGTMQSMEALANGARRLLDGRFARGIDDRLKATSYEMSSSIGRAVTAGTPGAAKLATRTGRDMSIVATNPTTYFNVDHVKDMQMGGRKLRGAAAAMHAPGYEGMWAQQNTAEAIAGIGSHATQLGSLNAGAASGNLGNSVLMERMGDTIAHQAMVDRHPV